jgi:hypothetical protein
MKASRLKVALLAAVLILADAAVVGARGLDLGIGWHRLADKTPNWRGPEAGGELPGGQPLYSLAAFFNDFGDDHRWRMGFRYTTHRTLHEVDGLGRSFRVQCFLLDYQREVVRQGPWRMVIDACAGLSSFSTDVPSPYDYSDDLSIHVRAPATVAPGLGWQWQIASQFSLQAGLWYYWILEDPEEVAPFRSGAALLLGVGYTTGLR